MQDVSFSSKDEVTWDTKLMLKHVKCTSVDLTSLVHMRRSSTMKPGFLERIPIGKSSRKATIEIPQSVVSKH